METSKTKFSLEIFPPKKESAIDTIYDTIHQLASLSPEFISVTYGAGGSIRNNKTVELASLIHQEYQISALAHLTCINSCKADINEILKELKNQGVSNILALRGDRNPASPPSTDFLHAVDLIRYIVKEGGFGVMGACYPEGHVESESFESDLYYLKEKVEAGLSGLISQLFFDNKMFYSFLDKVLKLGITVPIYAGIMPVTSLKSILRMTIMCGVSIPHSLTKMLHRYEYDEAGLIQAGIEYANHQIEDLVKNGVDGIHLYTMNNPKVAKAIYGTGGGNLD